MRSHSCEVLTWANFHTHATLHGLIAGMNLLYGLADFVHTLVLLTLTFTHRLLTELSFNCLLYIAHHDDVEPRGLVTTSQDEGSATHGARLTVGWPTLSDWICHSWRGGWRWVEL